MLPEDIRAVAHDVLRHRIGLSYEAGQNDLTSNQLVTKIVDSVPVLSLNGRLFNGTI